MSLPGDDAVSRVLDHADSDAETRVTVYNRVSAALRALVRDLADDPVLGVQLVAAAEVVPNDYNPNRVAGPELDLLEQSIRSDGITMPVVTVRNEPGRRWVVVDGFHRRTVVALPLTTTETPAVFPLLIATPSVSASSKVRTEHIRAIDKSRLSGYITDMGSDDLAEIERALCKVLGIKA